MKHEKAEHKELVAVTAFLDYKDFLSELYLYFKRDKLRYSYLEFSAELGLGRNNALFLIIKGKRNCSQRNADKISKSLKLGDLEQKYWKSLVSHQNEKDPVKKEESLRELVRLKAKSMDSGQSKKLLSFFDEWYHAVIFELVNNKHFLPESEWINKKLRIPLRPKQIKDSFKLLEDLNLIKCHHNNYTVNKEHLDFGDEISSLAVIRFHQKFMDLAKNSLLEVSEHHREVSSLTVTIAKSELANYKKEIRKFRKAIAKLSLNEKDKEDIYQLNIQFFPLSKTDDD